MEKLKGLKKVCSDTRNTNSRNVLQLSVNIESGEIWTDCHADTNSWVQYENPSIKTVCYLRGQKTMKEIKNIVESFLHMLEKEEKYN